MATSCMRKGLIAFDQGNVKSGGPHSPTVAAPRTADGSSSDRYRRRKSLRQQRFAPLDARWHATCFRTEAEKRLLAAKQKGEHHARHNTTPGFDPPPARRRAGLAAQSAVGLRAQRRAWASARRRGYPRAAKAHLSTRRGHLARA